MLATLRAGKADDVTIAVIYRPPSMSFDSIESFLDDLSDLLLKLGDVIEADRLVLCGDFNCPGSNSTSIRTDLSSLLDAHGLQQFVTTATRRTLNIENPLDLVIGGAASTRIRQVGALSSHGVSDHDLVT
jgi:endonuclease/exonuclease/phosphatase family metal-dependent hydrolase